MSNDNELEIMLPDVTLTLAGESVTVAEYSFVQGMQVQAMAKPLLDGMAKIFLDNLDSADQPADQILNRLGELFGQHPDLMVRLLSMSVGKSEPWIDRLSDGDGQTLLLTWWVVNKDFFARRLTTTLVGRRVQEPSAGGRYSPD